MTHQKTKFEKLQNAIFKLKTWQKNLLAFLLGGLLVLAFAPFHFFPILFISLPTFFHLIDEETVSKKQAALIGLSFGFGFFLCGIHWIAISLLVEPEKFAWLIPFALTLIPSLLACYFAGLAAVFVALKRKLTLGRIYQKIILFSLVWLGFELLRAFLFSGFPWNLLGYVWLFNENFAQIGSLFGVYGASLFAVLTGVLAIYFVQKKIEFGDKIFISAILVLLGLAQIFGYYHQQNQPLKSELSTKEQEPVNFLLVQANISQEAKWREEDRYHNLIKHARLTRQALADSRQKIAAVIWSETSIPFAVANHNKELIDLLAETAPSDGFLISGAIKLDEFMTKEAPKAWNSVFVFDKSGIKASYDKHHLVPFGEYVPFYQFFSFLLLDGVVEQITGSRGGGFSEGDGPHTIKLPSFSFSPLICYEAIFSGEALNRKDEPEIFINLTNDAWFGNSIGPHQHLDIARMRAIEYQKPLLRVASTGISAHIDEFGRIVQKIGLNQEEVAEVSVKKSVNQSIYFRFGNWPLAAICLGLLAFIGLSLRRKKTRIFPKLHFKYKGQKPSN